MAALFAPSRARESKQLLETFNKVGADVYIIGSRSGGWIMNDGALEHLNYQKGADKILSTKLFDTEATPSHKGFASDGSYIGDQEDWNDIEKE